MVKLLVVDDEELIKDSMCDFFRNRGYEAYGASDGEEALLIIEKERPNLVLLDVMLAPGGLNGFDVLKKIKEKDNTIKVIIITGKATDSTSVREAEKLGANDYLMKPLYYEKLEREALPKIGAQLYEDFRKAADENKRLYEELKEGVIQTITALAKALDARDRYTFGHSERVAEYAVGIAGILGFSEEEKELLRIGGLLHDIGKLGISDEVLRKPGRLTKDEYDEIKKHPSEGVEILKPIPKLRQIGEIILRHHERYDGKGYPDGVLHDVSEKAQIIAVADRFDKIASWILPVPDSYDAMTSPRPYRDALPHETAMEELVSGKGTQFDPKVVDAFQKYYEKHKEVSYAPELLVDYRGYPIMLVGEDRDVLENVKSSLGKHLTIEIAENIQEALDILEEGKKIYLMIIFQRLSEIIKQEELNKIIEGGFPITKIAFHTMEHTMHYDEILSNCQVFKYIFNPSEPQALKMEIIKEIQHAIAKVGAANP